MDFTNSFAGYLAIAIFVVAYSFVIAEEFLHLRKSKPMLICAGLIWILIGVVYAMNGDKHSAAEAVRHNLLEYGELLLFLLAAMTYVNTLQERNIFEALRARLVSSGFSLRTIFWLTGLLAFLISPIADNLTTALLMGAVVIAVAGDRQHFAGLSCINIVVAANAGGAFSPFGDITTLMVWQKGGLVEFQQFFSLVLPAAVNWLIPALIMSFAVPKDRPQTVIDTTTIKRGGFVVLALFLLTISMAVCLHNFLHMPPFVGMMFGLGLLKIYGYVLRRGEVFGDDGVDDLPMLELPDDPVIAHYKPKARPFDIFISVKRAEWDTLLFFYGVILSVGGLGALGYLALLSEYSYAMLGPTWTNIGVGILSAIVDNIPVMFAVLTMLPDMSVNQWLLVTLTAGVGGSLLSIGSAAGIALMGQARGIYTFFFHLKWSWAIALGYMASIWVHLMINPG
jgi:Na+/H+ antiporter NhaD/arsenite permease-like protein